jgi:NAD(P)-dependent dehydrogenase (short-subunit alcohol dehydrogenase family)
MIRLGSSLLRCQTKKNSAIFIKASSNRRVNSNALCEKTEKENYARVIQTNMFGMVTLTQVAMSPYSIGAFSFFS